VHPSTPDREVVLRFRGLSFARWNDGQVFFDAGGTSGRIAKTERTRAEANGPESSEFSQSPGIADASSFISRAV
jgi:hypothetical protein